MKKAAIKKELGSRKTRRPKGLKLIDRSEEPPTALPLNGLDRHECKTHGFIVDALKGSTAWCPCGRKGTVTIKGEARDD